MSNLSFNPNFNIIVINNMSSLSIPFYVSLWAQTRIGKGIIISSGSVIRHVSTACTELLLSAPEVCCVFAPHFPFPVFKVQFR
jgi:hypothetical protein